MQSRASSRGIPAKSPRDLVQGAQRLNRSPDAAAPAEGPLANRAKQHSRAERRSVRFRRADSFYETNAFRTDAAVHRFVPWIVGTFSAFSCSAICSSDIRFASIALIFIRHV